MKVIFLDIDGVMNSNVFFEERHKKYKRSWRYWKYILFIKPLLKIGLIKQKTNKNWVMPKCINTFNYQFKRLKEETCPQKWEWLSEWCNENDVKICISSVWRNNFGDENGVIPIWWDYALVKLGFKPNTFVGITGERRSSRGEEIKEWLEKNKNIEDYAIIDDDSDMLEEQFKKFYHCDGWFGMTPNHLYRIGRQFDGLSNYEKSTFSLR